MQAMEFTELLSLHDDIVIEVYNPTEYGPEVKSLVDSRLCPD